MIIITLTYQNEFTLPISNQKLIIFLAMIVTIGYFFFISLGKVAIESLHWTILFSSCNTF